MRGVIFNSMITTTVTMPALILLGVMAAYWFHRHCHPEAGPRQGGYLLLAALLPPAFLLCLWPPGHVSGGKTMTIFCAYTVYYLVAMAVYAVCSQSSTEGRARAFRFFFVLLSAAALVSVLLTSRIASGILSVFGLVAFVLLMGYVAAKFLPGPVWTWTPPPVAEAANREAPADAALPPAPFPSVERLLLCGALIICIAWLCVYVYSLRPLYAPLVLFWVGLAGVAIARREGRVSPSPSPPSPDAG